MPSVPPTIGASGVRPRRPHTAAFLWSAALFGVALAWAAPIAGAKEPPLHQRIDQLLAAAHPAGEAALAADADFLRRAFLELTGCIPSSAQARAFFADTAPDKRAKLVDQLIASGEFNRWMAVRFDVMLMERRAEKHTKSAPWREFLEASFAANKPWDQLVRELLVADGADEKTRPLARWGLEREGEPHVLTRDTGRIFLGRDMACAQCHDDPRIADYLQRDYYGLEAFFSRTYLFQPDKKKPAVLGEHAEGQVEFASVFTKIGGSTLPRMTGEAEIAEPALAPGELWSVPPNPKDKNARAVPKFSRRAQLAAVLGDGHHPAFRQNIANRLWYLVFGRGLVEPLDLYHSGNPPSNPALLDLLANSIAAMKFDMKAFVRELALTQAFQRALEVPAPTPESARATSARLVALEEEAKASAAVTALSAEARDAALKSLRQAQRDAEPHTAELKKHEANIAAVKKPAEAVLVELKKAEDALAAKRDVHKVLGEAAAKGAEAAAKVPGASELVQAAKTFSTKAEQAKAEIAGLEKTVAARKTDAGTKAQALAAAEKPATAARAKVAEAKPAISKLQTAFDAAAARKRADETKSRHAARLVSEAKAFIAWAGIAAAGRAEAESVTAEAETAERARDALASAWSESFALLPLVALTPEQMCQSVMQATGAREQERTQAAAEWDKKNPLSATDQADAAKRAAREAGIETLLREKVRLHELHYARAFGGASGQPQTEFFATPHQGLYFENGGVLRDWAALLAGRLAALPEPKAMAEELYLGVLTRPPSGAEIEELASTLVARPAEGKIEALTDLTWALLTSVEFRFIH